MISECEIALNTVLETAASLLICLIAFCFSWGHHRLTWSESHGAGNHLGYLSSSPLKGDSFIPESWKDMSKEVTHKLAAVEMTWVNSGHLTSKLRGLLLNHVVQKKFQKWCLWCLSWDSAMGLFRNPSCLDWGFGAINQFQAEELEGGSKEVIGLWKSKEDGREYLVLFGRHHSSVIEWRPQVLSFSISRAGTLISYKTILCFFVYTF